MNEEFNFQVGISGDGLTIKTEQAVQNIQQADVEKGLTSSIQETEEQPKEVTPEIVQEQTTEQPTEETTDKPTARDYVADTFIGLEKVHVQQLLISSRCQKELLIFSMAKWKRR